MAIYVNPANRYWTLEEYCDYLIIEPDSIFITHYVSVSQVWKKRIYDSLEDIIELAGIGATLTLREVYRGVFHADDTSS